MNERIIERVEQQLEALIRQFEDTPSLFFVENDLTCNLVGRLTSALDQELSKPVTDIDGKPHQLVHCEYPTPFRCDMSNYGFSVKDEDARTPKGGKYARGHFDVAVINPRWIENHTFSTIKGQNFESVKRDILPKVRQDGPVVLYGVELMYRREDIKLSRGPNNRRAVESFVDQVLQDASKLDEAKKVGFIGEGTMLVFVKGSSEEIQNDVKTKLDHTDTVRLAFTKE